MLRHLFYYYSQPENLVILNASSLSIILICNAYFPVFCIPSQWASYLLILCFANLVSYPMIMQREKLVPLASFLNGITLCVLIYCVIFLGQMNKFMLFLTLFIVGFIGLIPHFFIFQLLRNNLIYPIKKNVRRYFITAVILCCTAVAIINYKYNQALVQIENFKDSNYQHLEKTFFTEKILGMHFIYHTKYCEYDGWRPPIHEPLLVVALWMNNLNDPLDVDLKTRLKLYKKFFPEREYKFETACCYQYRNAYHDDSFWY